MTELNKPDLKHLHLLKDIPYRPIFIVGDHRSGTTLLHRLLAQTGNFNFVSAYHVIRYNAIVNDHLEGRTGQAKQELIRKFEALGLKDRIIDNVPATPDAPVEYGFILAGATGSRRPLLTDATMPVFHELCRKIQYVSDPGKPLLLKNPWDVMNFAEIKARIPEARLVFIHRHPLHVMTSQLRAIRSMLSARNGFVAMLAPWYDALFNRPVQLFAARALDRRPFRLWERLLGIHQVRMTRYYLENIGRLQPADFVSIRYEDLCRQPDEMMGKILRFCGADMPAAVTYKDQIEPRPPKLLEEAENRYRLILKKIRPFLDSHGYEPEPALGVKG